MLVLAVAAGCGAADEFDEPESSGAYAAVDVTIEESSDEDDFAEEDEASEAIDSGRISITPLAGTNGGFIVPGTTTYRRTRDGGRTWEDLAPPPFDVTSFSTHPAQPGVVWAIGVG